MGKATMPLRKNQAGKASSSGGGAAAVLKKNPFEARSNKKEKHPALNRKIMGANRNVGQARLKAQERREATLLPGFRTRKSASQIEDRRFGENNQALTREEKMLKRFQALRSNRAQKYALGDDDKHSMTHLGQSLSELLDNENIREEEEEEEEEEVDVDDLVQRMRNGETFSGKDSGKRLSKREAMMDVIRKSKMLKMERQKDKEEDEEERDRLDEMTSTLVQSLAFRPPKHLAPPKPANDTYDKMVRELELNPRVAATDRTKSEEELAKEERDRLEALEEKRIKRMADESDGEEGSDSEEDGGKHSRDERKRKKKALLNISLERELLASNGAGGGGDVPFLIECPKTHAELLEFLQSFPEASLDQVLSRIRTTNSIHLQAANRQKLIKLCQILIDHLMLVGDRVCQGLARARREDLAVISKHLFALIPLSEKECASMFFVKLERAKRLFDLQQRAVRPAQSLDLGRENAVLAAPSQRMPGGHKDGLAQQLNATMEHLAKLRGDAELSSSTTRVWPTGGEFALYATIVALFSTTDFRHPITTPCSLFLANILVEAPVRGSGDLLCALQCAQLVEALTRVDSGAASGCRFVPELFCFLRVVLGQLQASKRRQSSPGLCIRQLDGSKQAHAAFDFLRNPKGENGSASLNQSAESGNAYLHALVELMQNVVEFSISPEHLPSGDVLLQPLCLLMKGLPLFEQAVLPKCEALVAKIQASRQKLRLQEFAPVVKASSMDPHVGPSAARPGEVERSLKRKVKEERKSVSRELRLDGRFLAEASQREKQEKLDAVRAGRRRNFADLQTQQAQFNQMVKSGFAVKGAGVGGLNLKGRRMGKKLVAEDGE